MSDHRVQPLANKLMAIYEDGRYTGGFDVWRALAQAAIEDCSTSEGTAAKALSNIVHLHGTDRTATQMVKIAKSALAEIQGLAAPKSDTQ